MKVARTPQTEADRMSVFAARVAHTLCQLGEEHDDRVKLAAALAVQGVAQGHLCIDLQAPGLDDPAGGAVPKLEDWLSALHASPIVGDGSDPSVPLVLEGHRLYLRRTWLREERLADQLRSRIRATPPKVDAPLLEADLARLFPAVEESDQKNAARMIMERTLSVVSGGPGTGKTTLVARVIAMAVHQAWKQEQGVPRVVLTAPTGRAAARLMEATAATLAPLIDDDHLPPEVRESLRSFVERGDPNGGTLHRLLGLGGRSRNRPRRALAADLVVVDEASMVDAAMLDCLFEAAAADTQFVFLGDRDQLVSVGPGRVMGDLCGAGDTEDPWVARLSHSFRHDAGGRIGTLAQMVREGRADDGLALLGEDAEASNWVDLTPDGRLPNHVLESLVDRFESIVRTNRSSQTAEAMEKAHRAMTSFGVLCAHRRGRAGVETLNARISRGLGTPRGVNPGFAPGYPLMVEENDADLGVFNGDLAFITGTGESARFGDGRTFPIARLPAHASVFALTVHKSQGSEYDEVVVVLPSKPSAVTTRELLYTALTRARRKVTVIGTAEVWRDAVSRQVVRSSGLAEKFRRP